eukprot:TRINITY_DN4009_c0_g1_i3.p1 TRINITY_DN4009_c0_g1~~TRINITY_DN4009_c0_g1_i3.p1  ORF type:complete len:232 (+),score=37.29 TRINITY_DN4009_c0_g1_i3:90-698(+)
MENPLYAFEYCLALMRTNCGTKVLEILVDILSQTWDIRFKLGYLNILVLEELNNIIRKLDDYGYIDYIQRKNKCLLPLNTCMKLDIRVILLWDHELVDIELVVTEPSGNKCTFLQNTSNIGGYLCSSCKYGPSYYQLKEAQKGEYIFEAQMFSSEFEITIDNPVSVKMYITTCFGSEEELTDITTGFLWKRKQVLLMATINI